MAVRRTVEEVKGRKEGCEAQEVRCEVSEVR